MRFPTKRMRRLRKTEKMREIVKETRISPSSLIYPVFVKEDLERGSKEPIETMPGQYRYSPEAAADELKKLEKKGLNTIILFGIPSKKDNIGSSAFDDKGIVQETIRLLKDETELIIITDVCLCQYTSHGHCGIIKKQQVLNDETLEYLGKIAVSHARAGADIVAPSDMMDGRVAAIRKSLDENGFQDIPIMSYAVKYASSFYAPFREAVSSTPSFGDRKTYQMDPANAREAIIEAELDIEEGADIIMVKPALPYLDIIRSLKEEFKTPLAAYNVSGEYSMLTAAIQKGYLTEEAIYESILSIKRAGADLIISHFTPKLLDGGLG
ncbi:porphobilinogen synthase [Methanothermobacter tenebrarum]|uniref:Delta-aminolevulinic acid dehydratase n=1 Tax=Methanothermobacter tenebrarum TaxID=680118 RepID=A0A328PCM5_9EURY|nr:porphobilinogen synthase [Methanothermobacter tenebrarum]MBC7100939.1 porphobilinogen synthase [Methanobacteriales archaeon]MBC7118137.1 porphobilinogen synthase [Methanobacteriaceae archaeon]NPV64634.1 porphobilinogen synthase [Methanobacteriaceae archaeon]RAO78973.1 porphobilinogen synthase [Methanothermobacter tenebrarum]